MNTDVIRRLCILTFWLKFHLGQKALIWTSYNIASINLTQVDFSKCSYGLGKPYLSCHIFKNNAWPSAWHIADAPEICVEWWTINFLVTWASTCHQLFLIRRPSEVDMPWLVKMNKASQWVAFRSALFPAWQSRTSIPSTHVTQVHVCLSFPTSEMRLA